MEPKNRAGFDGKDVGIEDFEERLMECALEAGATNVKPVDRDEEDETNTDNDNNKAPRFVVTTEEPVCGRSFGPYALTPTTVLMAMLCWKGRAVLLILLLQAVLL